MPPPLVLLPPSEGKAAGGRHRGSVDRFARLIGAERTTVLEGLAKAMAAACGAEQTKLLRVRGPLLERAVEATERLIDGDAPLLPAWRRYSGVVWDHLEPSTLPPSVRARILVPSALYGITTAQDHIADYRLGMATSLPGVGGLARFWRPALTDLLQSKRRGSTVIDLLTAEHRAGFDWSRLGPVVTVDFVEAKGRGAAGHIAKAVKGRFARHLIDGGLDHALDFRFEGWSVRRTDGGFEVRALR